MNDLQIKSRREEAFKFYDHLKNMIRMQGVLFLQMGQTLKVIRDEKVYQYLGDGGYESFRQFINDPEIALRYSTAYLYIRVYEYYVEQLQLKEDAVAMVPLNRLMKLLPALKEKTDEEARGIMEEINQTTNFDYDEIIKERKLERDRPDFFQDRETGKYILHFREHQIKEITNKDTGDVIFKKE